MNGIHEEANKAARSARRQVASCILKAMSIRNAEVSDIVERLDGYSEDRLNDWIANLSLGNHPDGADELRLFSDVLIALDFEPEIRITRKELSHDPA